jgi:tight adherence protein C
MLLALQVAAVFSLTLAMCLFGAAVVTAPVHPPQRLGLRGQKRALVLARHGAFASIEPLVRWLSARLSGFVSTRVVAQLDRQITRAGDVWGLSAAELVALCLLSGLLGGLLGWTYGLVTEGGLLFSLLLLVLGLCAPLLQLTSTAHTRLRRIERSLPQLVDLLTLALSAGLDLPGALRQIVQRAGQPDEPAIEELRLLLQELSLGRTRREALAQLSERAPCESVRALVGASMQSEDQGTPLGAVLATQAASSRQRRTTQAEEAAARAGTAMLLPLVLLFCSVLLLMVGPMVITLQTRFGN